MVSDQKLLSVNFAIAISFLTQNFVLILPVHFLCCEQDDGCFVYISCILKGFANIHYEYSVQTPSNCYCRIVSKRDSQTAMIARGDNVPVWQQGILPNLEKGWHLPLAFQPKYFGGITFVSILICLGV